MDEDSEIRRALEHYGEIRDIYQVHVYEGWRGDDRLVIHILDMGPDSDNALTRYSCVATKEDGTSAIGNAENTIDNAISGVHWTELDGGQ